METPTLGIYLVTSHIKDILNKMERIRIPMINCYIRLKFLSPSKEEFILQQHSHRIILSTTAQNHISPKMKMTNLEEEINHQEIGNTITQVKRDTMEPSQVSLNTFKKVKKRKIKKKKNLFGCKYFI